MLRPARLTPRNPRDHSSVEALPRLTSRVRISSPAPADCEMPRPPRGGLGSFRGGDWEAEGCGGLGRRAGLATGRRRGGQPEAAGLDSLRQQAPPPRRTKAPWPAGAAGSGTGKPANRAGKRVERSAHVDGLDGHEHARGGWEACARSAPTSPRSVATSKSLPTSTRTSPTRTTSRAGAAGRVAGISTTSAARGAGVAQHDLGGAAGRHRGPKFIRHAFSHRPSTPLHGPRARQVRQLAAPLPASAAHHPHP
jgi:hypothetical protein